MTTKRIFQRKLDNVCKALLTADADIRDIVLFGSFAYAPSLSRDVDLVVTTSNRKDYGVYLVEGDALGHTIQIGRSLTVELLAGQGARQFIITFWHEMVEFAAINGALQVVTLSHDGVEATALALADLYGAPTFRVLSLVLESLGL